MAVFKIQQHITRTKQAFLFILRRICFAILLRLSYLKRMLTYATFSKCWVIVQLLQLRFTHIRVSTNRKIFFQPSTQERNLKSGYSKNLTRFLTYKASKNFIIFNRNHFLLPVIFMTLLP